MAYSSLFVKKNPSVIRFMTIISFMVLLVALLFFVRQRARQNGWQRTDEISQAFIVNRTPHSFELVWSTKQILRENQWVEVGTQKGSYPLSAASEKVGELYHSVVSGLQANTEYYFRMRVGNKTYNLPPLLTDTVHTPKEVKETPISPAYGKVVLSSAQPYTSGLLMYEIDGYYPIAAFTKETGEWLLPLTGLVEKKSNAITSISDSSLVSITLFSYPKGVLRTRVGGTQPLKQAYIAGSSLHLVQSSQPSDSSVLGASSQAGGTLSKTVANIIYPKEGALIPGNAPLIRGTAAAGKDVTMLIQAGSLQYSYRTTSDEKGEWLVHSPLNLVPGVYAITATIDNVSGPATIVRRSFSIIKNGEQVLGVATGSPTLAPTNPVVPTYSNPLPTTAVITHTPTPINTTYPTTTSTPPVTGGGMSGFIFGALFCIVTGVGLILAF